MLNLISQYITAVWATTCELAPWFLVGALVAGLLHGLAPSGFVRKRFQGKTGVVLVRTFRDSVAAMQLCGNSNGIGAAQKRSQRRIQYWFFDRNATDGC